MPTVSNISKLSKQLQGATNLFLPGSVLTPNLHSMTGALETFLLVINIVSTNNQVGRTFNAFFLSFEFSQRYYLLMASELVNKIVIKTDR